MKTKPETRTKPTGGRPALPEGKARSIFEKLRVNEEEREAFKRAARKAGCAERSEWMRKVLMDAAGIEPA